MHVQKFRLQHGMNEIEVPIGSRALSVCEKEDGAVLYAAIPDNPAGAAIEHETRAFVALATDEAAPIGPSNSEFIGTVRKQGTFTWHVFEVASQGEEYVIPDAAETVEA